MNTKLEGESYISHPIEAIKRGAGQWIKTNLVVSIGLAATSLGAVIVLFFGLFSLAGVIITSGTHGANGDLGGAILAIVICLLLSALLIAPLSIALDFVFISSQNGARVRYGVAVRRGFRRFLPALGAYVLAGLAIILGLLLLIVPGIWLVLRLSYLNSVVAYEDLGPLDSVKRAFALTKNNLWDIVGIGSASVIVSSLINILLNVLMTTTANQNVSTGIISFLLICLSMAAGLYLAQAFYFRYHQSVLEKAGELKKEGTDKLNYYLLILAIAVAIGNRVTSPEQMNRDDFRLNDLDGTV